MGTLLGEGASRAHLQITAMVPVMHIPVAHTYDNPAKPCLPLSALNSGTPGNANQHFGGSKCEISDEFQQQMRQFGSQAWSPLEDQPQSDTSLAQS